MSSPSAHRKRAQHFDLQGHAHFLTFSCYRRLPLLSKDRSRRWFIDALEQARRRCQFDLWAWVIMPEHVHLLLCPRLPMYRMGDILARIKRPVGVLAIEYLRRQTPRFLERLTVKHRGRTYHRFWQAGPGYDRNLWTPAAIHESIAYIHGNPVRRGLVDIPEAWPWSSAADWAGHVNPLIRVDRSVPVWQVQGDHA